MKKHTTLAGALLLGALTAPWVLFFAVFQSCSREEAAPREIRAHTRLIKGIAHAEPADYAERYCSYCHGAALTGGKSFEPSCYQCHGKTWSQAPERATVSAAPVDHELVEGGVYRHKQTLFTPQGDCSACHGADLEGSTYYPSCLLCHTKLWEERAAAP